MKQLKRFLPLFFMLPLLVACSGDGGGGVSVDCTIPVEGELDVSSNTATYCVTFSGTWTPDNFGAVTGSAHFTNLAGAAVSEDAAIWETGALASPGTESLAETGKTGSYKAELEDAVIDNLAQNTFVYSGTSATGSRSFIIELSRDYPALNFATMVAPSPDWFVGTSALSMLNLSAEWLETTGTIPLPVYDAGTENGDTFSLDNTATEPAQPIATLNETVAGSIEFIDGKVNGSAIATVKLKRIE